MPTVTDEERAQRRANSLANLKPFTRGDPRIHKGGTPKTFTQLRKLAAKIALETARDAKGNPLSITDGGGQEIELTIIERILREWAESGDPRLQLKFVEIVYGGEPIKVEHSGTLRINSDDMAAARAMALAVERQLLGDAGEIVEGEIRLLDAAGDDRSGA